MSGEIQREIDEKESEAEFGNRLSMVEAISYTAVIAFIGALAAGWLDGMVPWK